MISIFLHTRIPILVLSLDSYSLQSRYLVYTNLNIFCLFLHNFSEQNKFWLNFLKQICYCFSTSIYFLFLTLEEYDGIPKIRASCIQQPFQLSESFFSCCFSWNRIINFVWRRRRNIISRKKKNTNKGRFNFILDYFFPPVFPSVLPYFYPLICPFVRLRQFWQLARWAPCVFFLLNLVFEWLCLFL